MAFTLMSISAVCNLRNAGYMTIMNDKILFYLVVAVVFFFIPCVLVSVVFSSNSHDDVGLYGWVKEGLGPKLALAAAWFQWLENIFYYPILSSFIAATAMAFLDLDAENPIIHFFMVNIIFWFCSLITMRGLNLSSRLVSFTATLGLIIPALVMVVYGLMNPELFHGQTWTVGVHDNSASDFIAMTSVALTSFMGIEIACVHSYNFKKPHVMLPLGILISAFVTVVIILVSSLVVLSFQTQGQAQINSGLAFTFRHIFSLWGTEKYIPLMAFLLLVGPISTLITWVISPVRSLQVTFVDHGILPKVVGNDVHANPKKLVLIQAVLVTLLSLSYLYSENMTDVIILFSESLAVVYLFAYVLMFYSAIKLAWSNYFSIVPNKVVLMLSILGMIASIIFIFFAFFESLSQSSHGYFIIALIMSSVAVPFIMARFSRYE